MRYLVTGGAGFIGSHLCEALLESGNEVVCLDNFNDYYDPKIKERNISVCLENNNFTLVKGDITEPVDIQKIGKVDCIIHLAARAGVRPSVVDPNLYLDVNVNGTVKLLNYAVEKGIKNFVFGSSSSVYGISKDIPFSEENIGIPISPYGASKMAGEYICRSYSENFDMNISCLRFFTVYGPRNRPDMALFKFTKAILAGDKIPMFGDGSAKRDFTFVADIVSGVIGAAEKNKGFNIYNIGNNKTITLKEYIDTIAEALGKEALIDQLPMQPGDVPLTYANIDKAKKLLGYNPKTTIAEGIPKFVKWYNEVVE